MIDTGLNGKVVLVTGGNNPYGIGAATAKAFASQGAKVFIQYLRTPGQMIEANKTSVPGEAFYLAQQAKSTDDIVYAIREGSGQAEAWEADLSDIAVIPELFDRAEKAFGPVEVLINNAAHCNPDTFIPQSQLDFDSRAVDGFPLRSITSESHDRHFAVNSRAVALMMAEFARRHIERSARWGRIINVSTDSASGFRSEVSYGASKYALESYSRAAAIELGQYGITVNIASLGPIQTGWITPEMEQRIAGDIPLGRVGQPEDVADVIVFLASEQARWLTGQLLYIGGGAQMSL
ncbi:MAG: SDR family oxidoreductase [Chloroflexi bacterium]|nr:MAG: SDR family oxidoreductase [Chloroflexota bacterium]